MDNPTVPKAETASKMYSIKRWRLPAGGRSPPPTMRRREVMTETEKADAKMMEIVRLTISRGIVRLKILTSSFPFRRFQIIRMRRAALVVFTPPPVEPGEAPMNIRTIRNRTVAFVRSPISTVLKPQVLGVMDWNNETRTFVRMGRSLMM
jgi:hypothetical protein